MRRVAIAVLAMVSALYVFAVPASGSFDDPVFDLYLIRAVENATWGKVKSLYR